VITVNEESTDDDLYAWSINALAEEYGAAEEVRPSVIRVWSIVDGDRDSRPFELHISRAQLRSVAYASVNVFDDSRGDVSVPANNTVHAGLDAFAFATQEAMDSGSHLSRTYEFDRGQMRRFNLH
jgi:hypothetical protein